MWSCPGNMPKYYPGLRDILPPCNMPKYYLDKTTLLYKYQTIGTVPKYYLDKTTLLYKYQTIGTKYNRKMTSHLTYIT